MADAEGSGNMINKNLHHAVARDRSRNKIRQKLRISRDAWKDRMVRWRRAIQKQFKIIKRRCSRTAFGSSGPEILHPAVAIDENMSRADPKTKKNWHHRTGFENRLWQNFARCGWEFKTVKDWRFRMAPETHPVSAEMVRKAAAQFVTRLPCRPSRQPTSQSVSQLAILFVS